MFKAVAQNLIDQNESQRKYTPEGYLIAPANIARTGIMQYRGFELCPDQEKAKAQGIDQMKIYNVYRDKKELFSKETIESFENKPFVVGHKEIDSGNWTQRAAGTVRDIQGKDPFLTANIIVNDRNSIDEINRGVVQLSCGYSNDLYSIAEKNFDYDVPIDTDYVAENIRGNHVALVPRGRAGTECRIMDEKKEDKEMDEKQISELLDKKLEPILAKFKDENELAKLKAENEGLKKQIESLDSKLKSMEKVADADEDEDEDEDGCSPGKGKNKEDTADKALDNATIIENAKKMLPGIEIKPDKKMVDIELEVLRAVSQDFKDVIDEVLDGDKLTEDGLDPKLVEKAFKVVASIKNSSKLSDALISASEKFPNNKRPSDYGKQLYEKYNVSAKKEGK